MRNFARFFANNHQYIFSACAILAIISNIIIYSRLANWGNRAADCDFNRRWMFENEEFLQKSAKMWSAYSKESYKSIVETSYPNVVDTGKQTCVSLAPFGLGGEPVYCFDNKTKKATLIHQEVE